MGLSISKRLVNLMHGNMWVESEVQQGSKFYFTVSSQISPMSIDSMRQKMKQFQKRNILFLNTREDEAALAVRELIEDFGCKPTVIDSVSCVSDKATCPHIDTIVVDSLHAVCISTIAPFTL